MDNLDPLYGAVAAQLVNLVVMWLRDFGADRLDGERRLDVRITWGRGRPGERDSAPR